MTKHTPEIVKQKYTTLLLLLERLAEIIKISQQVEHGSRLYLIYRDSEIKRFEFCADMIWKYLKLILDTQHGITALSPKSVYRASATAGIISEQESETLFKILEARNTTSHTYQEKFAEERVKHLPDYCTCMQTIVNRLVP